MAVKKYHVSKNLFDKSNTSQFFSGTTLVKENEWSSGGGIATVIRISCEPLTTYTISGESESTIFRISLIESETTPDPDSELVCIDVLKAASVSTQTFTTTANTKYILVQVGASAMDAYIDVLMLNKGSTALPYESYGNTWNELIPKIYNTSTDTITTLPVDIIPDGQPISDVTIKGNVVQSDVPSPSNPIYPSACGDKTANLTQNQKITSTGHATVSENDSLITALKSIEADTTYTLSWKYQSNATNTSASNQIKVYGTEITFFKTISNGDSFSLTSEQISAVSILIYYFGSDNTDGYMDEFMLVKGSTAQPYEPYGYKIPVNCGGITTNIYLGEVQTTRRIKKLVLDGTEVWNSSSVGNGAYYLFLARDPNLPNCVAICSHVPYSATGSGTDAMVNFDVNSCRLRIDSSYDLTQFKQYLSDQYAAGTPVTVWYVLASETTSILNEPIRKIGDYADSVSVTGIPTTAGSRQFDVNTALKPSEIQLTYHGWHPKQDKEYSAGSWS